MSRLFLSVIPALCLPFALRALTFEPDDDVLVGDDVDDNSTAAPASQSLLAPAEDQRRERQAIRRIFQDTMYGAEHFQNASLLSGEYSICTSSRGSDTPLTVLTLATSVPPDYLELMRANRMKYVMTQGLQYCEYAHTLDAHRKDHWSKLIAVQELFRMEHPVVLWMDADALFMRCGQSFLPIIDHFSTFDVIFSADVNSKRNQASRKSSIQTSVFLIRNSTFASGLLETWLGDAYRACRKQEVQEQCAVQTHHTRMLQCAKRSSGSQCKYYSPDYHAKVVLVPWNYFNSPGNPVTKWMHRNYQRGDFIMHWGGGTTFNHGSKYEQIASTFWNGACK